MVTVDPVVANGTVITNTASVTSTEIPTPTVSNEVTNTVGAPILSISKANDPAGLVAIGDTLTYTIVVSNSGSITATDVTISDTLPSAVSDNAVSVTVDPAGNGTTSVTPPQLLSGAVISPNATITLTVVVTIDPVVADGTLYVVSARGQLHAFR